MTAPGDRVVHAAVSATTADGVGLAVDAAAHLRVRDPARAEGHLEECDRTVSEAVRTAVRRVLARTGSATVRTDPDHVGADVRAAVDALVDAPACRWGVQVERVDITVSRRHSGTPDISG